MGYERDEILDVVRSRPASPTDYLTATLHNLADGKQGPDYVRDEIKRLKAEGLEPASIYNVVLTVQERYGGIQMAPIAKIVESVYRS